MNLDISNIEYNLIKKKLKQLEEAYKQSSDNSVRNAIKDQVYYDLCAIDNFDKNFGCLFAAFKMSSLKEIDELSKAILTHLAIQRLPQIEYREAKKMLKLPEKALSALVKGFNEATEKKAITYYSQQIDEKFIILFYNGFGYDGVVCNIAKSKKVRESLCHFCNSFRSGNEIVFATNTVRSKKSEHNTLGINCCRDHNLCNSDIQSTDKLTAFIAYKGKE